MTRWLAAALLLLATPALADDSECATPGPQGGWLVMECFLCDGDHSATDCAEFDFMEETLGLGLPEFWYADLAKVTGCSGTPEVDVRGMDRQLGLPQVYGTLVTSGTTSLRVSPLRHRHIDADVDITTSAGCTDLEVVLRLFYSPEVP